MAADEDVHDPLLALHNAKSTEIEVKSLEDLKRVLMPFGCDGVHYSNDDTLEQEFLDYAASSFDDDDNPFPSQHPEILLSSQETLNRFTCYLFERRFGWSEAKQEGTKVQVRRLGSVGQPSQEEAKYKDLLNGMLDDFIKWYLHQKISLPILESLGHCMREAADKPVVRNQTTVHTMEWLKLNAQYLQEEHFEKVKDLILLGLTDVWSAIRNACVSRLSTVIEHFTISHLERFFSQLVQLCQSQKSNWQAKEGAIMGINVVVRRFQWIGMAPDEPFDPSISPRANYYLKFGCQELNHMPEFISSKMQGVIYPLLAHPQLSIRENASKAFSSFLARCEFKEALSSFKDVIHQLCRGTAVAEPGTNTESVLPHRSLLKPSFKCMDAYESEGLLGVCVFLVKHIPPGFLLPNWPLFFSTFNLYLMHPASTVRQATSTIFKFLVAKDSNNPTILKLVLQGLSQDWEVNMDLLTAPCVVPAKQRRESLDDEKQSSPSHRSSARAVTRGRRQTITNLKIPTTDYNPDVLLAETWEWREGRLFAYELILKFLIKNHWLYTFGPHSMGRQFGTAVDDHQTVTTNSKPTVKQTQSYGGSTLRNALKTIEPSASGSHNAVDASGFLGDIQEEDPLLAQRRRAHDSSSQPFSHLNCQASPDYGSRLIEFSRPIVDEATHRTLSMAIPANVAPLDFGKGSSNPSSPFLSAFKSQRSFTFGFHHGNSRLQSIIAAADRSASIDQGSSSIKTLVRHYSYYTKPSAPFKAPKSPYLVRATSLLSYTKLLDSQQPKGYKADLEKYTRSPRGESSNENPSLGAEIFRSSLCPSPAGVEERSLEEELWWEELEVGTLSELLKKMLYQTVECLADARWEIRRMGQQVLPCLVEVIRWYDMHLLEELWASHLMPTSTLLCYGACIALKYSVSHAARLMPMITDPPLSWQDMESCRQAVLKITNSIRSHLPAWLKCVHSLAQRPTYDKLSIVAVEIIMLAHSHFTLAVEQKSVQEKTVVNFMQQLFKHAHPDLKLVQELGGATSQQFQSTTEGCLSCCVTKVETDEQCAKQVEKQLLSEMHSYLLSFVKSTKISGSASLIPILVQHLGDYSEDAHISKHLADSLITLAHMCNDFVQKERLHQRREEVLRYCYLGLKEIANLIMLRSVDLTLLRQVLDVYVLLSANIEGSKHLLHILQAICARLNNVKDFSLGQSPREEEDDNLAILSNNIPAIAPQGDEESDTEEEEDKALDTAPDSMLAESLTLNLSGSGSAPSGRLSAISSSTDGRVMSPASNPSDAGSDWDSWSEDEEDHVAMSAMFSEFLHRLQMYYAGPGKLSDFSTELSNLNYRDRKFIEGILEAQLGSH